ncbi:glycosyltransferase family 4 protein [Halorarum halophilum]|uniref:Glycosyltransferase family 4 protein n=1 Tax=Halorarum halophilum TaxID=2743090 RepID=A0A7D5KV38_9EURY|nr:glycosyltransferase family 4 protein [Halobaculum halophilum]QLG28360.1 glycosyltransferase family 4 protein [Halobaculum halophilum]
MQVLNLVTSPDAEFYRLQVRALERQGIDETTLGVPGEQRFTDDGVDDRSVLDYLRYYPQVLRESFDSYDLVHANYGLTAPAAIGQPNLPVVLTLWGTDLMGKYGRLGRLCARRADAVIVMSERMAETLPIDCHVIPHGVDLEQFRPFPQRPAREAIGWRHDASHVLFPYPEQRPVKDYPRAERVVEAARERYGGDIDLQTLYGVPHERMPLYMNAADALLLTSRREGSPNSVKEAMACDLPVVATDVGDVRTRLAGVDGSHVCRADGELVDGLVDVLERGEPSTGREAIAPLGLEQMGERIRAVYESVLDTRAEPQTGAAPTRNPVSSR